MVPPPPVFYHMVKQMMREATAGCMMLLSHLLVKQMMREAQAGCMMLLSHPTRPAGLPSCLPLHQGVLLPRSIFMTPLFRKMVDPPLLNIAP